MNIFRFAKIAIFAAWTLSLSVSGAEEFRAVVTYFRPGTNYFFCRADGGEYWRVGWEAAGPKYSPGDVVSVRGEQEKFGDQNRLFGAKVELLGREEARIPAPETYTIPQMHSRAADLTGDGLYSHLVKTRGKVVDITRRKTVTQLVLVDGGRSILAELRWMLKDPLPEDLAIGADVSVAGTLVFSTMRNPWTHEIEDRINLNILGDLQDALAILSSAPWWTPARAWTAAGAAAVLIAMLVVWLALLLRAVRAKKVALFEADLARRERLELAADLHDNFQQLLAGAMFHVGAVFNYFGTNPARALHHLNGAKIALVHTQSGLRTTLWGMTAESEGPQSITALFQYAIARMPHWEGIVALEAAGREPIEARKYAGRLLMVMQEAVANAINHGEAKNVKISLSFA